MSYKYDDPAHEHDMEMLRREQLRADISPEEAEEECAKYDEYDGYNCEVEEDDFLYDYEVEEDD
jgi:hypothetical protein